MESFTDAARVLCPRCAGEAYIPIPETYGERLRLARELKGYTLRQLAKLAGSSSAVLCCLESGKGAPVHDALRERLARVLGEEIMGDPRS